MVNLPVGAWPYDCVFKKLDGSNDSLNLSIDEFKPSPTFLKLGTSVSSLVEVPPPIIPDVVLSSFIVVVNLRDVFCTRNILDTESLNCAKSLSVCSYTG